MSIFKVKKQTIKGIDRYCVVLESAIPGMVIHSADELVAQMLATKINEAVTEIFEEIKFDVTDCFNKVTNHAD